MTKAAALNRRVEKEIAALLVSANRIVVARADSGNSSKNRGNVPSGKVAELKSQIATAQAGLANKDQSVMRQSLAPLDALVDELHPPQTGKSIGIEYIESIVFAVAIALLLRTFVVEAFKIPSASMYPTLEINDHIFVNKLVYGARIPFTDKKLFTTRSPKRGEVAVFVMPCTDHKDYIKRIVAVAGDKVEVRCDQLFINEVAVPRTPISGPCTHEDRPGGGKGWYSEECLAFQESHGGYQYTIYQKPTGGNSLSNFPDPRGLIEAKCEASNPNDPVESASAPQTPGKLVVTHPNHPDQCSQQAYFVVPPGHVFAMGDNRDNSTDSRFWGAVPLDNMKGKAMFIWLSFRDWNWSPFDLRAKRMGNFVH
jgi:signal peptidase I